MATKSKRDKLAIGFLKNPEQEIKKNIQVLPEFENLIPPLSVEEFDQLRQNILAEGCREPLILWHQLDEGQYILIDGHNRYRICRENGIKFNIQLRNFPSSEGAKDWMLSNQLGRRNLTSLQQSYLRGKRYTNEKQAHGGLRTANNKSTTSLTADQLAEEYGVNEKTIRRDEQFAKGLDKLTKDDNTLRWKILNGEVRAKKKTITDMAEQKGTELRKIKKSIPTTNSLEQAAQTVRAQPKKNETPSPTPTNGTLHDIRQQINRITSRAIRDKDLDAITELRQLVDHLELALK